jgi:hypothetical protein
MRHRTIILTTLLLAFGFKSFSQQGFNTEKKDSSNVYYYALIKYCDYLDKQKDKTRIIYVEKNYLITDDFPDKIKDHFIKSMDNGDVINYLKGRESMTLVRIVPLRVKGNDFFVNVIPFGVSYKKKNFNYINGGGLGVKFEFDPKTNGLIFKSSEMGGI